MLLTWLTRNRSKTHVNRFLHNNSTKSAVTFSAFLGPKKSSAFIIQGSFVEPRNLRLTILHRLTAGGELWSTAISTQCMNKWSGKGSRRSGKKGCITAYHCQTLENHPLGSTPRVALSRNRTCVSSGQTAPCAKFQTEFPLPVRDLPLVSSLPYH